MAETTEQFTHSYLILISPNLTDFLSFAIYFPTIGTDLLDYQTQMFSLLTTSSHDPCFSAIDRTFSQLPYPVPQSTCNHKSKIRKL